MRYIEEFRQVPACRALFKDIERLAQKAGACIFMEFCGGHTHALMRYGLRSAMPGEVHLLSGPGCPVCVTAQRDVDLALAVAALDNVTLATFGDMMRVPGTSGSLQEARAKGADVRVVYSITDALKIARANPSREVIFLGVGFETTAPGTAAGVVQAAEEGITNFSVLSLHKLTPPAMRAIIEAGEVHINGIIGPGHVTTVIGSDAWRFLPEEYGVGCVVSGFEPCDMLMAIRELVRMAATGSPAIVNSYQRSAASGGNQIALALMHKAFAVANGAWRGLGVVPDSVLELRPEFEHFDARRRFSVEVTVAEEPAGCRCGEILRGVLAPVDCPLFGFVCTPESPVGPCMVSSEGACAAHYAMEDNVG